MDARRMIIHLLSSLSAAGAKKKEKKENTIPDEFFGLFSPFTASFFGLTVCDGLTHNSYITYIPFLSIIVVGLLRGFRAFFALSADCFCFFFMVMYMFDTLFSLCLYFLYPSVVIVV